MSELTDIKDFKKISQDVRLRASSESSFFSRYFSLITERFWYLGIALFVLLLDQGSKLWAYTVLRVSPTQTMELIQSCFDLTYTENTGIAFSLLANSPSMTRWILMGISFTAAAGVFLYSLKTSLNQRWLLTSLALISAGACGNAIDRITHGAVIDFIHVYFRSYHWPIFNIADSSICVGSGILILDVILHSSQTSTAPFIEEKTLNMEK